MKYTGVFIIFALKLLFLYYINAIVALSLNFADWHYIHRGLFGILVIYEVTSLVSATLSFINQNTMEESNG